VNLFHWIAGWILGLVWLSRVIDAGFGVRKIPDISQPEWDREPPARHPRVAIIVTARNEEESIEKALLRQSTPRPKHICLSLKRSPCWELADRTCG